MSSRRMSAREDTSETFETSRAAATRVSRVAPGTLRGVLVTTARSSYLIDPLAMTMTRYPSADAERLEQLDGEEVSLLALPDPVVGRAMTAYLREDVGVLTTSTVLKVERLR